MRSEHVVAIVLFAALAGGCTCVGCGESFSWTGDLPADLTAAELVALHIRACRNEECVVASSDQLPVTPSTSGLEHLSLSRTDSPGALPRASLWMQRRSGAASRLLLQWYDVERASNGDRYMVEVTDSTGAVIAGLPERAVDYRTFRANGALDPTECRTFEIAPDADAADGGEPR